MKNSRRYLALFLLTFLAIGGCDIDFGGNANDDGGNGGGSNDEIIQGNVVEVIPVRENNLSGITAVIMEEDGFLDYFIIRPAAVSTIIICITPKI